VVDREYISGVEAAAYELARDLISSEARNDLMRDLLSDEGPANTHEVGEAFEKIVDPDFDEKMDHLDQLQSILNIPQFGHSFRSTKPFDDQRLNPWKDHPILGPLTHPDLRTGYEFVKKMNVHSLRDLAYATMALKAYDSRNLNSVHEFSELEARAEIFISLSFKKLGQEGLYALYEILDHPGENAETLIAALRLIYLVENSYPGYLEEPHQKPLKIRIANLLLFPKDKDLEFGVRNSALLVLIKTRSFQIDFNKFLNHKPKTHPFASIEKILREVLIGYREEQEQARHDESPATENLIPQIVATLYTDTLKSRPAEPEDAENIELAQAVFLGGLGAEISDDGSNNLGRSVGFILNTYAQGMTMQSALHLNMQEEMFRALDMSAEASLTQAIMEYHLRFLSGLTE
jgi:hypothetical protein